MLRIRKSSIRVFAALLVSVVSMAFIGCTVAGMVRYKTVSEVAMAEAPEMTQEPVEIVVLCLSAESQLENAAPVPAITQAQTSSHVYLVRTYKLTEHEIRVLCRLLWMSPLRSKYWKMVLLDVVVNRMYSTRTKENGDPLFGNTVDEVVSKKEFTIYDPDAYVSDENIEIVKEWAQSAGRYVPVDGLYMDFVGDRKREVVVYDNKPDLCGELVDLREEEEFE